MNEAYFVVLQETDFSFRWRSNKMTIESYTAQLYCTPSNESWKTQIECSKKATKKNSK